MATEDLESVIGGLEHHGGGVVLRQAGLTGGLRSSVDLPRGLPGQQPGRVNLNCHLGQHESDCLLLGDGGAERAPLFSVVASVLEGGTCHADGERRQGHARAIQQESEVTCQPRRGRYAAVVQGQLIRGNRFEAHVLLTLGNGQTWRAPRHDEGTETVVTARVHQHVLRLSSKRDEAF